MTSFKIITTNFVVDDLYDILLVDANNNDITLNLPNIFNDGVSYIISRIDNNNSFNVILKGFNSSQLVEDNLTYTLQTKTYLILTSYGIDDNLNPKWIIPFISFGNSIITPLNQNSYNKDIIQKHNNTFQYHTPNNGIVKIMNINNNLNIQKDTKVDIPLNISSFNFSSTTNFPKNFSNLFPNQNPLDNKMTFLPNIYNLNENKFLENPISFQPTLWRFTITYTRTDDTKSNRELIARLTNPLSNFELTSINILPNGREFTSAISNFYFQTIADINSINNGYVFSLQPNGLNILIDNIDLVRTSLEQF